MLRFRKATDADFPAWNDFMIRSPHANLRQSVAWGEIKRVTGWVPHYYLVERDGVTCGVALVQERMIPLLSMPLLYCCTGPVVDWQDRDACEALLAGLRQVLAEKGALLLRVSPEPVAQHSCQEQILLGSGLLKIPERCTPWNRTLYTARVNLDLDENGLFMRMRKTHRQNIKTSVRGGVVTSSEAEAGDPDTFAVLMQGLEANRNSLLHSSDYYRGIYQRLVGSGTGYFIKARLQDQIISGLVVVVLGDKAWAVFIANDYSFRNLMPNKLLVWEAIRLCKQSGCRYLDLGASQGSPDFDPANDPLDRHKNAYHPEIVRYPGYFDLPGKYYPLFRMMERRILPSLLNVYVKLQRKVKR